MLAVAWRLDHIDKALPGQHLHARCQSAEQHDGAGAEYTFRTACDDVRQVLEEEEYMRRKEYYHDINQRHYYFMNVGNGEVIDACRKVSCQLVPPFWGG